MQWTNYDILSQNQEANFSLAGKMNYTYLALDKEISELQYLEIKNPVVSNWAAFYYHFQVVSRNVEH